MEAAAVIGVAAGLFAILGGKKSSASPSIEPIIAKAVPIVKAQIAAGVPAQVAVEAAATATLDVLVRHYTKAGVCVRVTRAQASKSDPLEVPSVVLKKLIELGWVRHQKGVRPVSAPLLRDPAAPKGPWDAIVNSQIFSSIEMWDVYLCPPGKTPYA